MTANLPINERHHDDEAAGAKQVIFSVKSGGVSVKVVRDLRGVLDREHADWATPGVLTTLEPPTQPMRTEAATCGFYQSPYTNKNHPKLQILTVEELLNGRSIAMPPVRHTSVTFKKAPRAKGRRQAGAELPGRGSA